jgi:hypothetical protein
MKPLMIWLIGYFSPAVVAGSFPQLLPTSNSVPIRDAAVVHGALIFSIFVSQYTIHTAGLAFPWNISTLSLSAYVASTVIAVGLIGLVGLWYALSALIQQLTLLSITFLLLTACPAYLVVLLVVPPFVLCHKLWEKNWRIKATLITVWGVSCIGIFIILPNLWLIAGLHAVFGALLMSLSIL